MLSGFPILIVEDERATALLLAAAIEELECRPIGPVSTVAEGLALLETEEIAAAIVDAHLADRDVTPLALALIERQIPFVVHTDSGIPVELAELHHELSVVPKPAVPTAVLAALLQRASPDRERFNR